MNSRWPKVTLVEVLRSVERSEPVDPMKEYRLLGVRLDGQGPFLRETIQGSQSAAAKFYRVAAGDFIYSRLFANRGAFGVIRSELDGCYVSGEFPTFLPEPDRLDPRFLRYWFRLPATLKRVNEDCTGSTPLTRNRFKEHFFLALEIPLPPLAEQRQIVARIEELAAKIEEARTLRQQAIASVDNLLIALAHRLDLTDTEKERALWRKLRLGECMDFVDDLCPVVAGRSYPNLGIYSFARGLFHKQPIDGTLTSATALRRVKTGQFIYSRLFAFEGAYGLVSDEFDGHFVSTEYPTFECRCGIVRAEFLAAHFKAPSVWRILAEGSKGLGHRRQRVQPARVLAYSTWIPPMAEQERIAGVHAELNRMKRTQSETAAELDALLPSILDRAFKGEL